MMGSTDRGIELIHRGSDKDFHDGKRLPTLPDCSVDSVVTDPPYELGFMGKAWDKSGIAYNVQVWRECLRVLKPGGHLLAFGGSRTYHRLACAVEDAGFDIRDQIQWIYASGFPKSHNLDGDWKGWGTALKPAHEPIVVARKPLEGTVAENVTRWGTGAINVDGCRVGMGGEVVRTGRGCSDSIYGNGNGLRPASMGTVVFESHKLGRWPANIIHDGSDEVVAGFPGEDSGSTARFFYCAKASKADRDDGCEGLAERQTTGGGGTNDPNGDDVCGEYGSVKAPARNHHPTVKPTTLMRYLCRLVTPPGGLVLDPFAGSGSTGRGAVAEGFRFIGIELSEEYAEIARRRIAAIIKKGRA